MAHFFVFFLGLIHHIQFLNTPGGMESALSTPVVAAITTFGNLS